MSERVDHTNYEAWLLDRLEGGLTPEQERELDAFLLLNPELAPESEGLPTFSSFDTALAPAEKAGLKKSIPPAGLVTDADVADQLIARSEGDLSAEQQDALRVFLVEHPEWQRAEKLFALTKLVPTAMAYSAKAGLVRQFPPQGLPTTWNMDDFLIARLEGDLTREQQAAVERLLAQDPKLLRAWALMQATRTEARPIEFLGKEGLKKKEGRVIAFSFRTWTVRLAAAASIAALIGLGLWVLRTPKPDEQELARVQVPATTGVQVPSVKEEAVDVESKPVTGANERQLVRSGDSLGAPKDHQPSRSHSPAPGPVVAPPEMMEPAIAQDDERRVDPPGTEPSEPTLPLPSVPEPETTIAGTVRPMNAPAASAASSVGVVLASTLRDRVLHTSTERSRPLGTDDVVAMADRTLKAVGGDHAGLDVEREGKHGVRRFSLSLGRHFSVSASR